MNTVTYTVKGMTCSGCVNKVVTAVSAIEGIEPDHIDVDVSVGTMELATPSPVDDSQVREAIRGAGYEVTS